MRHCWSVPHLTFDSLCFFFYTPKVIRRQLSVNSDMLYFSFRRLPPDIMQVSSVSEDRNIQFML